MLTGYSQNLCLVATLLVVTPLSWMRTLNIVAITSSFGVLALILAVLVVTMDAATHTAPMPLSELPLVRMDTYPLFLGNAAFLYLISTAVLPIYASNTAMVEASLASPSAGGAAAINLRTFGVAFNSSTVLVTLVNLSFGLFAWQQYGDGLESNVVANLPAGATATIAVQVLLAIDLVFTSIVFLFPFSEAFESELGLQVSPPGETAAREWQREMLRNALRTVLVVAIALVAYLVPSFSLLTGLTGGFGNNILGFILPPLFYWRLQAQAEDGYWASGGCGRAVELALLALTFTFGIVFLLMSTASFLAAIKQENYS